MPRPDRYDRNSLSRVSVGRASELSSGSVATRHWVNSVSDIYGPDEIEELLEDLNRLELAALEADDFRDYDIDGSRIGGCLGRGGDRLERPPPRERLASPEDEEEPHCGGEYTGLHRVPSPSESINSWDSHVHYRRNENEQEDEQTRPSIYPSRLTQSIICFCDTSTFKTPRNFLRVLLVVTSVACLSTVLTAGTAKSGIFALPHFPRLRLIIFVSIFTILFTLFILFLNISHLHALLPVEYGKMQTVVYLILTVLYVVASSLLFHLQSEIRSRELQPSSPLPHWTKNHLIIAACLGFVCGVESFLCCFTPSLDYRLRDSSTTTHFTLQETTPRGLVESSSSHPPPHSRHPPDPQEGFRSVINPQRNADSSLSPSKSDVFLRRQIHRDDDDDETKFIADESSTSRLRKTAAATAPGANNNNKYSNALISGGAIPKTGSRRENHVDEIVSLPMDDLPPLKIPSS